MKKFLILLIVIIVIIISVVIYFICKDGNNMFKKKEINSIKEIEYNISDGRRINGNTYYHLVCDEKCILYSKPEGVSEDEMMEIEISDVDIESLLKLFKEYNIGSWDGFNKADKHVLDGTSYTFKVVSKDNVDVYVSGYMKYPKNFRECIDKMIEIFEHVNSMTCKKLFCHEYYKDLNIDDVTKVVEEFYGEGGLEKKEYTDKEDILRMHEKLSRYKLQSETKRACEDNTKIYRFITNDGKEFKVEIECDWIVINNKRYLFTIVE